MRYMKRAFSFPLVVLGTFVLVAPAHAQDPSPPVGIDSLCGPGALTIARTSSRVRSRDMNGP